MRNLRDAVVVCFFAASLSTILGCNSKGSHLPKTVPAQGVVTLDGKPVDGAQVVLVPAGQGTTGAEAITNSSGRAALHMRARAGDRPAASADERAMWLARQTLHPPTVAGVPKNSRFIPCRRQQTRIMVSFYEPPCPGSASLRPEAALEC